MKNEKKPKNTMKVVKGCCGQGNGAMITRLPYMCCGGKGKGSWANITLPTMLKAA